MGKSMREQLVTLGLVAGFPAAVAEPTCLGHVEECGDRAGGADGRAGAPESEEGGAPLQGDPVLLDGELVGARLGVEYEVCQKQLPGEGEDEFTVTGDLERSVHAPIRIN